MSPFTEISIMATTTCGVLSHLNHNREQYYHQSKDEESRLREFMSGVPIPWAADQYQSGAR